MTCQICSLTASTPWIIHFAGDRFSCHILIAFNALSFLLDVNKILVSCSKKPIGKSASASIVCRFTFVPEISIVYNSYK